MGTRKAQVRNVFIAQGVLIGVIGTVIGLVLGYAIPMRIQAVTSIRRRPRRILIDHVPFAPRLADDGYSVATNDTSTANSATHPPSASRGAKGT